MPKTGRPSRYPTELRVSVSDEMLERVHRIRRHHEDGPRNAHVMRRILEAGLSTLEMEMREHEEYRQAGVFTDDAADELVALGVTPEQAAEYVEHNDSKGTLGYWVANCDLSADTVAAYCRVMHHDCADLDQLADDIYAARRLLDADGSGLQTFGGEQPDDTSGVWSWDATRLLVGDGWDEMDIVERAQEAWSPKPEDSLPV